MAEPAPAPAPAAPKVAHPYAIMRMTHEAIRVGLAEVKAAANELAQDPGSKDKLEKAFTELERCIKLHMRHEDEKFFTFDILTQNPQFAEAGFGKQHHDDTETLAQLHKALAELSKPAQPEPAKKGLLSCFKPEAVAVVQQDSGEQRADACKLFLAWADSHEKHLKQEEDLLMPLTQTDAVEQRGARVASILAVDVTEYDGFQLGYVVAKLGDKYGPLSNYLMALQASSSAQDYERRKEVVKGIVPPGVWSKLEGEGITGEGKLP